MKTQYSIRATAWAATLAVSGALLVAACGGGGSADSGLGTGGTGALTATYTMGRIDGFGSVVVGGIRYDDSTATVADDDGASRASSELKLGMVVQLEATAVNAAASSATATRVRFGNEVVGPVSAVNTTSSGTTLTVLGQTVVINASTVIDDRFAGGLAGIRAGAVVEVHGVLDTAAGNIVATRIEPATAAAAFGLRGVVASLDTAAKTFRLGGQLVSYANLAGVPASLANGVVVRVRVQTTQVAGAWVATRLALGQRVPDSNLPANVQAHVQGAITVFTSIANFEIGGIKVDASNAIIMDAGTRIALGSRVEVEGRMINGVLVAAKVKAEPQEARGGGNGGNGGGGDGGTPASTRPLELYGAITSVDSAAKTFLLRGVTVSYAGAVVYKDGSVANLLAQARVEVKGVLSADRTRLEASRIEFK
jgi:Domain of unknown function (DUF5666)